MISFRILTTCKSMTLLSVVFLFILASLGTTGMAAAQTDDGTPKPPATSAADQVDPDEAARREAWRKAVARAPRPKEGCHEARYPDLEWREVSCVTPPEQPYPPRLGRRAQIVGNGTDYAGQTAAVMSASEGSFDSVTGVTSLTGTTFGAGCSSPTAGVANVFSLQLNTAPFTTAMCGPSPNANCRGWQQFVYSNAPATAFQQYWLLRYNTACPAGWNTFSFPGSTDIYCWRNGNGTSSIGSQTAATFGGLVLGASAVSGGNDTVTVSTPTTAASATNLDSLLNLSAGWRASEFNIFGDACGSQVDFNAGSTVTVRTTTHSGTTNAPTCVMDGYTGETNNLNLVQTTAVGTGPSPAIVFTQSNIAGAPSSCQTANGTGDTHLRTFGGLAYDFQASGDFVLVESDNDFTVQARMISGAPRWPNASVNSAVATRIGKTTVAVCLPGRVSVDGRPVEIEDGKTLSVNDFDIVRQGNAYNIIALSGDSVRAEVNDGWINAIVGLGHWPAKVRGLLANADRGDERSSVRQIATRDGRVLTSPFPFEELYTDYADSWRVPPRTSLLRACGNAEEVGRPKEPFFVRHLDPENYKFGLEVCLAAGVREGPLLDNCTLDVAVIGDKRAADAFVGMEPPVFADMP